MARARQLGLDLRTWGGKRKGAGRKPAGARAGVSHQPRPALSAHHPAHVTMRVLPHVWNLRSRRAFRAIARAFVSSKDRDGFRIVHFSVQGDHLHLIVEARNAQRLSRGMQGLATWIARRLNQLIGRRGKVFADRFHAQVLRTPLEVARAVAYTSAGGDGPALTAAPRTLLLRRGWRRAH
jgi:REP element-mobilizing transposase RayT